MAGLALVFLCTAVLPPAGAWALNRSRVERTAANARVVADLIAARQVALAETAAAHGLSVVCGAGRLPDPDPGGRWVARAVRVPAILGPGVPGDAWGRCFLVNVDALQAADEGRPTWVMSAGPNGVIETPPDAFTVLGDDIGMRVR